MCCQISDTFHQLYRIRSMSSTQGKVEKEGKEPIVKCHQLQIRETWPKIRDFFRRTKSNWFSVQFFTLPLLLLLLSIKKHFFQQKCLYHFFCLDHEAILKQNFITKKKKLVLKYMWARYFI